MTHRLHRLSPQSKHRFSGVRPSQLPHELPHVRLSGMNGIAVGAKSSFRGGEYDGNEFDDTDDGKALPMAPSHSNASIGSLLVLVVDDELDNNGACEPIAPKTLVVGALKLALNNPFMFKSCGSLGTIRKCTVLGEVLFLAERVREQKLTLNLIWTTTTKAALDWYNWSKNADGHYSNYY